MKNTFAYLILLAISCSAYAQNNLDDCLIAYYPFNGNANDESGHNKNGTVVNATLTDDRLGNPNSAYAFNGTSSYIKLTNNLIANHNKVAVTCWFKSTNGGGIFGYQKHKAAQGHPSLYVPALYMVGDGKLRGKFWDQYRSPCMTSPTALNDDVWHFATLTTDGSHLKMYVDGSEVASEDGTIDQLGMTSNQIGLAYADGWPSAASLGLQWTYFDGSIDEVRIYKCNLSASDVATIYSYKLEAAIVTNDGNNLQIYPDPASANIFVSNSAIANSSQASLTITDLIGRVVYENLSVEGTSENRIDVSEFSPGIYLMALKVDDEIYKSKFLKQ